MTTDEDRLLDLDEAFGKIARLAYKAWNDGSPSFAEVVEEVVITCNGLLDDRTDETVRGELEAVLPATWCPDLPLQERLKKLVKARRTWTMASEILQARIEKLEVKAREFGDPPLAVDPDAVVRLRLLLDGDPRAVVLDAELIELLKGVFGITHGPTHIEPAIVCPKCSGTGQFKVGTRKIPCPACDSEGKVPDVAGMRQRIAELEHERAWLRRVAEAANTMMAYMCGPTTPPPEETWLALELALADHRNAGYENSDHPDDFTAPNWDEP